MRGPSFLLSMVLSALAGCQGESGKHLQDPPESPFTPGSAVSIQGEGPPVVVAPPASGVPQPGRAQACSEGGAAVPARPRGVIAVVPGEGSEPVRGAFHRAHGRLVRCYAPLLKERPELSGELSYELKVSAEGSVEAVDLRPESDELPSALIRCLERGLWGLMFEPGQGTRRLSGRLRLSPLFQERPSCIPSPRSCM